jgi:protein-S-isoprenylcysteine O-methyltransferase Ste14
MIDLPPVWLAAFAVLVWLAGRLWPVPLGGAAHLAGLGLIVAGVGLMIAAAWEMRRRRTTVVPHQQPTALVTSGVFRFSRNPIYLVDALVLAGLCLRWDAPAALLLVPLFMAVIAQRFITAEESRLRDGFGPAFDAWAARTRRWV